MRLSQKGMLALFGLVVLALVVVGLQQFLAELKLEQVCEGLKC